jgi:hypothetical protein
MVFHIVEACINDGVRIMTKFYRRFHDSLCVFLCQALVMMAVSCTWSGARFGNNENSRSKLELEFVRMRASGVTNALFCASKSGFIYLDGRRVAMHFHVVFT